MTRPAETEAPTDPRARQPRQTVGSLDLQSAGVLEVIRGLGTSGVAVAVLYQLLTGQISALSDDVDRMALRVDQMGADVTALRVDVTRLQAQQDRP